MATHWNKPDDILWPDLDIGVRGTPFTEDLGAICTDCGEQSSDKDYRKFVREHLWKNPEHRIEAQSHTKTVYHRTAQ